MRWRTLVTVPSHQDFQPQHQQSSFIWSPFPLNMLQHSKQIPLITSFTFPSQDYLACRSRPFLHVQLHQITSQPSSLTQGNANKWHRHQKHSALSSHRLHPITYCIPATSQMLQGQLLGMVSPTSLFSLQRAAVWSHYGKLWSFFLRSAKSL